MSAPSTNDASSHNSTRADSFRAFAVGRLVAVSIGEPASLSFRGRLIPSAIVKVPVTGSVSVVNSGLAGDRQADQAHHGGLDKAVCAYSQEHYAYWSRRIGRLLGPGSFGENLTLEGLLETSVCLGDILQLGEVALQVAQPRQPCFKLSARFGEPHLAKWVQQLGLTGFYLRVLSSGLLRASMPAVVVERPNPGVSVAEVNRLLHHDRHDAAALRRVGRASGLSDRLRDRVLALLEGERECSELRLYGE